MNFLCTLTSAIALVTIPTFVHADSFGPVFQFPLIPITTVLLPDGRVLAYGTDASGNQGAQYIYDIWDPSAGTGSSSHLVLPNTTSPSDDIFCSGQSLQPGGNVLVVGGDQTINGQRSYSNSNTALINPNNQTIALYEPMKYRRWYTSIITLADERRLALGGRDHNFLGPIITPEIHSQKYWYTLQTLTSEAAFGGAYNNWAYPKGFVIPGGDVVVLTNDGSLFDLNLTGTGSITQLDATVSNSGFNEPTISFAPGRLLSIRNNQEVVTVDLNTSPPTVADTDPLDKSRIWPNATILASGNVLVNGGTDIDCSTNTMNIGNPAYNVTIWHPASGHWTEGASNKTVRCYHSTALLLPDGTVLTAGGGAPGPVTNLNAEIYYPPYLDGNPIRPILTNVPKYITYSEPLTGLTNSVISKVTLIRIGSTTHSYNSDQRYIGPLPFTQTGSMITAEIPNDPTIAIPGYWMMFVWDQQNAPSLGAIIRLGLQ